MKKPMTSDPSSGEGCDLVFVYGPLRRGASQELRIEGAAFVATGEVSGRLLRVMDFPGLVPGGLSKWVPGEVFDVSAECLAQLDEFHRLQAAGLANGGFQRIQVEVHPVGSAGMVRIAWTWQWTGPVDKRDIIPSGDWLDAEQPRSAPWLTWVALMCLASTPLCWMGGPALLFVGHHWWRWAGIAVSAGSIFVPVMAWSAAHFAEKRRERWVRVRGMVVFASLAVLILSLLVLLPSAVALLR